MLVYHSEATLCLDDTYNKSMLWDIQQVKFEENKFNYVSFPSTMTVKTNGSYLLYYYKHYDLEGNCLNEASESLNRSDFVDGMTRTLTVVKIKNIIFSLELKNLVLLLPEKIIDSIELKTQYLNLETIYNIKLDIQSYLNHWYLLEA